MTEQLAMTDSDEQRIREVIRARLDAIRHSPMFARSSVVSMESYQSALRDVNTLLDLLDRPAAGDAHEIAEGVVEAFCDKWGWIPDPAMLLDLGERIAVVSRILETRAAARMRDRCLAKMEQELKAVETGKLYRTEQGWHSDDIAHAFRELLSKVSSLTLEQEKQEKSK